MEILLEKVEEHRKEIEEQIKCDAEYDGFNILMLYLYHLQEQFELESGQLYLI